MKEKEKLHYIKETMESIAHQWRQPLSQINSTVGAIDKILYEKNIQDPLLEEKLQEIEALTRYMSDTIDDFKSHFTQNGEKESIKLTTLIKSALFAVESSLNEHNIELSLSIDAEYESICYVKQLTQILIILLNNAKDALLERNTFNAKIRVTLEYQKGEYIIKIADNAGGITKSVMEKIFEPYYTTKHKSVGTGIGLYMARNIIIERHDGSLSVKNVGEGTEFSITLPEVKNHE